MYADIFAEPLKRCLRIYPLMVFKFQVYGVSTDHTAWTNYMVKLKTQGLKTVDCMKKRIVICNISLLAYGKTNSICRTRIQYSVVLYFKNNYM